MITVFTQVPVLTQSEINPNAGIRVLNQQEVILNQLKNVITNDAMSRSAFIRQFTDPRRNINYECGYPESTSYAGEQYQELFDRFHIANRVVSLMPSEAWQVQPKVYEDESASNVTEFEQAWDDLGKQLKADSFYQDEEGSPIWNYLKRLNIVSGIGTFGVMLLGIDDGKRLDQPVDGVEQNYPTSSTSYDIYGPSPTATIAEQPVSTLGTDAQYQPITMSPPVEGSKKGPRKLLFLRVFSEKLLQVTQYESNVNSPRFGQPKMYRVTLNDPKTQSTGIGLPTTTVAVHWTRLIHVADNLINSEVFGNPRMLPVLNQLLDLRKVYAAASEGYWKQAFATMVIKSLPQLGGDPSLDLSAARNTIENIENGLSRSMVLNGFDASTLPPQVTDPTPYITNGIEAICIQLGVPVRVFKGSERGELASSQDDASWNDRLRAYQRDYITPQIIVKFIDRMIAIGVLPEPSGYSIEWPDLDSLTDKDKATIALTQTQAMGAYVGQGVENLIDPMNYFTKILGMDEETAKAILDDAVKHQEEQMEQDQALADEHGFEPTPPQGYKNPEPEQPEETPEEPTPLTVKPGEQLVHPQTGQTIAKGPPISPKPAANSNPEGINQYTKGAIASTKEASYASKKASSNMGKMAEGLNTSIEGVYKMGKHVTAHGHELLAKSHDTMAQQHYSMMRKHEKDNITEEDLGGEHTPSTAHEAAAYAHQNAAVKHREAATKLEKKVTKSKPTANSNDSWLFAIDPMNYLTNEDEVVDLVPAY